MKIKSYDTPSHAKWIDRIWPEIQAVTKASTQDEWSDAYITGRSHPEVHKAISYIKAWHNYMDSTSVSVVRTALILWWRKQTGKAGRPLPGVIEAEARKYLAGR